MSIVVLKLPDVKGYTRKSSDALLSELQRGDLCSAGEAECARSEITR